MASYPITELFGEKLRAMFSHSHSISSRNRESRIDSSVGTSIPACSHLRCNTSATADARPSGRDGGAGRRVWEAIGAHIEALGVQRGHRTLTILRKGGKIVTIPLAPRTARALDLTIGERAEGPIFLRPDGQRLDRHAAGRIVHRIGRRAGITKPVGPHTLRHAFITAALDAVVPLRDVQEAASHADPRTTMTYDRARVSLNRHATYVVAAHLAGAAR